MCKVTTSLVNSAKKYGRNSETFIDSKCNTNNFDHCIHVYAYNYVRRRASTSF